MTNKARNQLVRNVLAKHNINDTRTFSDGRLNGVRTKFVVYRNDLTAEQQSAITKDVQHLLDTNGLTSTTKVSWGVNAVWGRGQYLALHTNLKQS